MSDSSTRRKVIKMSWTCLFIATQLLKVYYLEPPTLVKCTVIHFIKVFTIKIIKI